MKTQQQFFEELEYFGMYYAVEISQQLYPHSRPGQAVCTAYRLSPEMENREQMQ